MRKHFNAEGNQNHKILQFESWTLDSNIDAHLEARTQMIYIYAQSEKQTEQSNKDDTFLGIVLVICVHCWSIMGEGVAGLLLPI